MPTTQKRSLDVIQIQSPCPADWNAMAGDNQRRFCDRCNKHVHNLSQMPGAEAERLLADSGGHLCVQFSRDRNGKIITLDYAKPKRSVRRLVALILGSFGIGIAMAVANFLRINSAQASTIRGEVAARPQITQTEDCDTKMGDVAYRPTTQPENQNDQIGGIGLPPTTQPTLLGKIIGAPTTKPSSQPADAPDER